MSAKPAGESLENARKPHSIYARTAQYFGECFLYNSNSIVLGRTGTNIFFGTVLSRNDFPLLGLFVRSFFSIIKFLWCLFLGLRSWLIDFLVTW